MTPFKASLERRNRRTTGVWSAFVLGCCLLTVSCYAGPQWSLAEGQHTQKFSGEYRREVTGQFLLYLPKGFSEHPTAKYPLLVFLHGSGESGTDIAKVKVNGPPKFLDTRSDFPFIVVSPQAPDPDVGFDLAAMNVLLDQLLQKLPIDKDRIYLTGLSLGGIVAYQWAAERPGTFAAIAPISAAGNTYDACNLKRVPIWAFHGGKDETVKTSDGQAMVDAIKECGGDVKLTIYPELGHSAWEPAYSDPALYKWFLDHRLGDAAAK
ncbi:MAG TPA: dienelactone hydrolase family protein [Steroidobacteraceae bacterium]